MTDRGAVPEPVRALRSAAAVRQRCTTLYQAALAGDLSRVTVDQGAWDRVLAAVAAEVAATHPTAPIPVHGRLNHLRGQGWDLAAELLAGAGDGLLDAVVISVLLDAGAGSAWTFDDPVAGALNRSEGLAVATHRMVRDGILAADGRAFGIDAPHLAALPEQSVADAFQVSPGNPLVGLSGRVGLLRALGRILEARGATSLGALLRRDLLGGHTDDAARASGAPVPATGERTRSEVGADALLGWLLEALADLWPGRIALQGHNLGDTWHHPLAGGTAGTEGLIPFHKLSQWLTWSLVEPLRHLGVTVTALDGLTGLAEYRNGGMLIDLGLVTVRGGLPTAPLPPADPLVVEWRAVTVAALDVIAEQIHPHLPPQHRGLGMGELLEAGTWSLGRRLARRRDPDGAPPIAIASDGTVF